MKNTKIIKCEYFIKKHTPKIIYKNLGLIWQKTLLPIFKLKEKIEIINFKDLTIKQINYKNTKFKILISPKNRGVDNCIYRTNIYEPEIMEIFRKHIKKTDNVIDIGGNIGYHSMYLSKLTKGKVFVFEPIKKLTKQIKISKEINESSNINIYNLGIGEKNETQTISLGTVGIGDSSIIKKYKNSKKEKIEIVSLDSFQEITKTKINFIKIDIEGYEYYALKGMYNILKTNNPKLIIEYSPAIYDSIDKTISLKLLTLLKKLNYEIYDIENNNLKINNINKFHKHFKRTQTNILCIPKNKIKNE